MAEIAGLMPAAAERPAKVVSIVRIGDVSAEYSTGRRSNGEWFALANLSPRRRVAVGPATLVIGLGRSAEEALQRMTARIEDESAPSATTA
jgi:hypothetical protein